MSSQHLTQFGINFRRVDFGDDEEKLRIFRNLPHVRREMFYQEEISFDSHRKWFRALDRSKNFYFIYSLGSDDIGVVNIKNIEFVTSLGEYGIFVSNQTYLGSPLNIAAVLFIFEYAFSDLGLTQLISHILPSNEKAIRMNLSLGLKLIHKTENLYQLSKSDYVPVKLRFEKLFSRGQTSK
jgi:RimJ/RimL family protein N-acetyltransferase